MGKRCVKYDILSGKQKSQLQNLLDGSDPDLMKQAKIDAAQAQRAYEFFFEQKTAHQIAEKYGVNVSSITRGIERVVRRANDFLGWNLWQFDGLC